MPETPHRPTIPTGPSSGKIPAPAVLRDDLHPKVKAGLKTYVGVALAGVIAAIAAAQQSLTLSPAAALGLGAAGMALPLVASYFKPGDGR